MTQFDINKKKFSVSFDPCRIETENVLFSFTDIKEMTLFINKTADIVEAELNAREKAEKENK